MARILYHFHALVATASGNCAGNTHDGDCSLGPLTPGNEVACNRRSKTPVGRPCRCEHTVPGGRVPPPEGPLQVWEMRPTAARKTKSTKKPGAGRKSSKGSKRPRK